MYKNRLFLSLSFLLALAGCTKEGGVTDVKVGDGWENHAYIVNEEETRTDFDSFVGKFTWTEGDKIAIHLTDGTFYETPVNPETKVFTSSTTSTKQRNLYAIYPASVRDNDNYGDPNLNVVLPDSYDITGKLSSDYSPVPMIAVNTEEESDLYFRHVGGLLRITCNAVPAGTKWISVSFDRPVTGTFTVSSPASTSPTISNGGSGNTVTFTLSESSLSEKTSGIILNVPLPTGPYTQVRTAVIDQSGSEIYAVTRDVNFTVQRFHGRRMAYSLTEVFTDSMQLVVTASDETGWEYTLPIAQGAPLPADLSIDWGDGTTSFAPANSNTESSYSSITHTYSSAGDYTITITASRESRGAMFPMIRQWYKHETAIDGPYDLMLKALPTPLLQTDNDSAEYIFSNCLSLETICPDLFVKNPQFYYLRFAFENCQKLQGIPAGLLDCLPDLENLYGAFEMSDYFIRNCGLEPISNRLPLGIPDGLFDNNPKITDLGAVFSGCNGIPRIPDGLFDFNPEIENFNEVFHGCSGITGPIPANLFSNNTKATGFRSTFYNCSGLTDEIPENLFANNPEVTSFAGTFDYCRNLSGSIPEYLFVNNTKVRSFSGTFEGCSNLTGSIPANLFAYSPEATGFYGTFRGCEKLSGTIPENLFSNQNNVDSFAWVFSDCRNLEGPIPTNLFATNPHVKSFEHTFDTCTKLTGPIPEDLFKYNTEVENFQGLFCWCSCLSGSIPENLFALQPEVTDFNCLFAGTSIEGEIPANLFVHQTKVTDFGGLFWNCTNLTGEIPVDLFATNPLATSFQRTFENCGGLTGSIPSTLFSHQTEAEVFGLTFSCCYNLSGEIPTELFASNPKAYYFYECFSNCPKLKIRPDIFYPRDRFSQIDNVEFYRCFANLGYELLDAGEAPDLWNYSFGSNVNFTNCFVGSSKISNYDSIPYEWK